jgi:hypothetical protein
MGPTPGADVLYTSPVPAYILLRLGSMIMENIDKAGNPVGTYVQATPAG